MVQVLQAPASVTQQDMNNVVPGSTPLVHLLQYVTKPNTEACSLPAETASFSSFGLEVFRYDLVLVVKLPSMKSDKNDKSNVKTANMLPMIIRRVFSSRLISDNILLPQHHLSNEH